MRPPAGQHVLLHFELPLEQRPQYSHAQGMLDGGSRRQVSVSDFYLERAQLTPKKSRSWLATTATTAQENIFCQGRLMVQSMTSATVMRGWAPMAAAEAGSAAGSAPPPRPPAGPPPPLAAAAAAAAAGLGRCLRCCRHCWGQGAPGGQAGARCWSLHSRLGPPAAVQTPLRCSAGAAASVDITGRGRGRFSSGLGSRSGRTSGRRLSICATAGMRRLARRSLDGGSKACALRPAGRNALCSSLEQAHLIACTLCPSLD